jgi:hypothetical protein
MPPSLVQGELGPREVEMKKMSRGLRGLHGFKPKSELILPKSV